MKLTWRNGIVVLAATAILGLVVAACGGGEDAAQTETPEAVPTTPAAAEPTATPSPEPTPSPTPEPTPTLPLGAGESRDNPVPLGQSLVIPEGWEITVVDFIPDATQAVLDENPFNDPPDAGFKYVIVTVRATNVSATAGATTEVFDASFALRLVRPRTDAPSLNVEIDQFTRSCGVIPNQFPFQFEESAQVPQGGTVEGNVCFHVGVDETGFVMLTHFLLGEDIDRRYFAIE